MNYYYYYTSTLPLFQSYTLPILHPLNLTPFRNCTLPITHSSSLTLFHYYTLPFNRAVENNYVVTPIFLSCLLYLVGQINIYNSTIC